VLLLPPTNRGWFAPFLALKIQQQQSGKCSAFASSALLHLFFILNSAISVGVGAKIFFPRAQVTPLSKFYQIYA